MINFDSRDKIEFIKVILSPIFKKWGKRQDGFWLILTLDTRQKLSKLTCLPFSKSEKRDKMSFGQF